MRTGLFISWINQWGHILIRVFDLQINNSEICLLNFVISGNVTSLPKIIKYVKIFIPRFQRKTYAKCYFNILIGTALNGWDIANSAWDIKRHTLITELSLISCDTTKTLACVDVTSPLLTVYGARLIATWSIVSNIGTTWW